MTERISIIVPRFNEADCIQLFYEKILLLARKLAQLKFEIIFVDDGSTDDTLSIVKSMVNNEIENKYISFSRNFGKEAAMLAGMEHSKGDYVVIMDADMQDPPCLLEGMYNTLKSEALDCVATRRSTRTGEPPLRTFFAGLFYKLIACLFLVLWNTAELIPTQSIFAITK